MKYWQSTTFIIAPPECQPHYSKLLLSKPYRTIDTFAYICMCTQGKMSILQAYPTTPIMIIWLQYNNVMIRRLVFEKSNANKHSRTSV